MLEGLESTNKAERNNLHTEPFSGTESVECQICWYLRQVQSGESTVHSSDVLLATRYRAKASADQR
jgi:hypothetical protein